MKKLLVDTNIFIDYFRAGTGILPKLIELQAQGKAKIYISSLTLFEILSGKTGEKDQKILQQYFDNIPSVPIDDSICQLAGKINRESKPNLAAIDFLIGVTAIHLKAQLVTNNHKHLSLIPGIKFYKTD